MEIDHSSPEVLQTYYRRLYPFKPIFHWINQGYTPTDLFTHREFSLILPGDVFIRYNSYDTLDELKKHICQLKPTRFEIGPTYSARPRDRKTMRPGALVPRKRELVFDIDMTDYDVIRTCCSKAEICKRCWAFISAAVHVLDKGIREQFGYEHLLWVYSGRRGIHLWISDEEALMLTDDQRKAVVAWLTIPLGGAKESWKKLNVRIGSRSLPPSLQMALEHLNEIFPELILADQDCFASKDGYDGFLRLIPDARIVETLRSEWDDDPDRSSDEKWSDFKSQIKKYEKGSAQRATLIATMEDIVLQYTYPRLDAEVSKHRNHLLKAPFCVHPKTGRVCVPVDPKDIDSFDPEAVPTVAQLLNELGAIEHSGDVSEHHSDWEQTSLKPYVDMLEKHTRGILEQGRSERRDTDKSW